IMRGIDGTRLIDFIRHQGFHVGDQNFHRGSGGLKFGQLFTTAIADSVLHVLDDNCGTFYATVMILLFCYNFLRYWFSHVWPVIRVPLREDEDCDKFTILHPQILTLAEIKLLAQRVEMEIRSRCQRLMQFRQDKPFRFFVSTTAALVVTALIGIYVKGLLLLYLSALSLMTMPRLYTYLSPDNVKSFLRPIKSSPSASPSSTSLASSASSSSKCAEDYDFEIISNCSTDDNCN
ncbi:Reticulophagy regulator 3, partial [Fragariocoptes setiger]